MLSSDITGNSHLPLVLSTPTPSPACAYVRSVSLFLAGTHACFPFFVCCWRRGGGGGQDAAKLGVIKFPLMWLTTLVFQRGNELDGKRKSRKRKKRKNGGKGCGFNMFFFKNWSIPLWLTLQRPRLMALKRLGPITTQTKHASAKLFPCVREFKNGKFACLSFSHVRFFFLSGRFSNMFGVSGIENGMGVLCLSAR